MFQKNSEFRHRASVFIAQMSHIVAQTICETDSMLMAQTACGLPIYSKGAQTLGKPCYFKWIKAMCHLPQPGILKLAST